MEIDLLKYIKDIVNNANNTKTVHSVILTAYLLPKMLVKLKPMFMKILRNKRYLFVDPTFIVDHENSDRLGLNLELEYGKLFSKRLMAYIRPGAGVHGDKMQQVFDWNIETGFRYFFR